MLDDGDRGEGNGNAVEKKSAAFRRFEQLTKKILPVTKQQIEELERQRKKRSPRRRSRAT